MRDSGRGFGAARQGRSRDRRGSGSIAASSRFATLPALAADVRALLDAAHTTPKLGDPASERAARQERFELFLDKARHAVARVRRLGEKCLRVTAYDAMHARSGLARGAVDR